MSDVAVDGAAALARARAVLARAVLGESRMDARVGAIELRPHQLALARRAVRHVSAHGGVLLAEPPGWGKTFVALAIARRAERLVVVAPAALRERWRDALARAGVDAMFAGMEWLSRAGALPRCDWVIVDESHHLRNPATRRYSAVAKLTAGARVVLLSATPVQNGLRDLAAQLALFVGESAHAFGPSALAAHVLLSGGTWRPAGLPDCAPPVWIEPPACGEWLDAILRLPPAVPPADGGDGGALLQYALARQWSSSRGALTSGLRRRLAAAAAVRAALEAGRHPTRRDLRLWTAGDDAMQLAFPELVVAARPRAPAALLAAVRRQERAVRALLDAIARAPDPDRGRAASLVALLDAHPGERIVAFTSYADTVHALARHLRAVPGVAWLTASGAHCAAGRLSRREVLRQLVPGHEPPRAERIRLLVTTDVLSEGLDLHAASVVVHLDLPWNPARLEQRVGRVRRLGARHARVAVYAFRPPASTERLLRVQARLRDKLAQAGRAIGHVPMLLPTLEPETLATGEPPARLAAEVAACLERWADGPGGVAPDPPDDPPDDALGESACVAAPRDGFVAAVRLGAAVRLVADVGAGATTDPASLARALAWAEGPPAAASSDGAARARRSIDRWSEAERGAALAGVTGPTAAAQRRALRRCASILSRAGATERGRLVSLVAAARRAIVAPRGVGSERALAALTAQEPDDARWLARVAKVDADEPLRHSTSSPASDRTAAPRIVALVLFARSGME